MKQGLASYLRKYNETPDLIRFAVSIETTGLKDPKIVDIATISKFLYQPVKLAQFEKETNQKMDVDSISGTLLEFQTIGYELINPHKTIEEGAFKLHGIDNAVANDGADFKDSKFLVTYKNLLTSNAKVELLFANSYALNVLNNELISAGVRPIYEFDADNLRFKFNDKFKVHCLDDIAMRFYSKDLSTFSLKKIQDLSNTVYGQILNADERETLATAMTSLGSKSPNAANAINKVSSVSEIARNFIMANPDLQAFDFSGENRPLGNFPFRRIGKQIINDISDVSVHHLFAILSKTEEQKGVATIATLKDALDKSKEVNAYSDTHYCRSNLEAFFKKATEDGLLDLNSREDYSKMFNDILSRVEAVVDLKSCNAEEVKPSAYDIIKRISKSVKSEGLTFE